MRIFGEFQSLFFSIHAAHTTACCLTSSHSTHIERDILKKPWGWTRSRRVQEKIIHTSNAFRQESHMLNYPHLREHSMYFLSFLLNQKRLVVYIINDNNGHYIVETFMVSYYSMVKTQKPTFIWLTNKEINPPPNTTPKKKRKEKKIRVWGYEPMML